MFVPLVERDQRQPPQRSLGDPVSERHQVRDESPVVTHLEDRLGLFGGGGGGARLFGREAARLLAQHRQPGRGAATHQVEVEVGWGGDDHAVDPAGFEQLVDCLDDRNSQVCDLLASGRRGLDDRSQAGARGAAEGPQVDAAHPAGPHNRHGDRVAHRYRPPGWAMCAQP